MVHFRNSIIALFWLSCSQSLLAQNKLESECLHRIIAHSDGKVFEKFTDSIIRQAIALNSIMLPFKLQPPTRKQRTYCRQDC